MSQGAQDFDPYVDLPTGTYDDITGELISKSQIFYNCSDFPNGTYDDMGELISKSQIFYNCSDISNMPAVYISNILHRFFRRGGQRFLE